MALTQSFKQSLQAGAQTAGSSGGVVPGQAMTPEQAKAWIGGSSETTQSQPSSPIADYASTVVKNLGSTFEQGGQNVTKDVTDIPKNAAAASSDVQKPGLPETILATGSAAGHIAGDIAGTAGGILGSFISPLLPDSVKTQLGNVEKVIADKINAIPGMTPEIAKSLGDVFNTTTLLGGGKAVTSAAEGAKAALPDIKSAAQTMKEAVVGTPEEQAAKAASQAKLDSEKADQFIQSQYTKAIKPSIAGKTAPGQIEKYNANVGNAVRTIVNNKDALQLTDQFGEPGGKLPESIDQFRQAIDQTKANIFKKYDTLAKTAGEKGATVNLEPVASELDKVVANKVVQDLHPDLAAYAKSRADTLRSRGSYSAEDAQAAIANLNKSLDAFYKNPSYETASKASVDALIANKLRGGLDSSIESSGGAGYQEVKNQYAALKSIEKDVTKRGIIEARQTGGRGMNVGDIVSAEELVRGLATLNPQALATAGAIKSIAAIRRYLTDPNRAIKQMFEKADATNISQKSSVPSNQTLEPQPQQ